MSIDQGCSAGALTWEPCLYWTTFSSRGHQPCLTRRSPLVQLFASFVIILIELYIIFKNQN